MHVLFLSGDKAGSRQEIGPRGAGIGRETDNEIQYLGGRISRYHARIEKKQDGWFILDLGSTNGTKVNGLPISSEVKLNDSDVVAVGELLFRIEDKESGILRCADANVSEKREEKTPAFVFRPPGQQTAEQVPPSQAAETKQENEDFQVKSADKTVIDMKSPDPVSSGPKEFDLEHLFSKQEPAANTEAANISNRKKRIVNLLFLLLVVIVAAFALTIFVQLQNEANDSSTRQISRKTYPNPFILVYEKREITRDNGVFCFKLQLENGHLSFSLDDLQSGRVYSPAITEPVRKEAIEKLQKAIADTNFMTAEQQEKISDSAENDKNYARIIIGFDDKFNDITVQDIVLTSFTHVENAIRDFLQEEYGVDPSMAKSRDELIRQARSSFDLAEKQFRSYKAQPENLWRSIENYKIAIRQYEVFAEKPAEWNVARQHMTEAEMKLKKIRDEGHDLVNLYYQQKEYKKAFDECTRLMCFFSAESESYRNIRSFKIKLEKIMNEGR